MDFLPGELIVKPKTEMTAAEINALQEEIDFSVIETTQTLGIQLWEINGMSVEEAIEILNSNPQIEYAEPNFVVSITQTFPNDPRFDELYGLNNTGQTGGTPDADIDAPEAWDIQTGSSDVVIGVIDTGVDYNHPDLDDNMWTNPGEIRDNGIDDDGNGFVDDFFGYDFINDDSDPFDDNSHGTHVSGTIAAEGNNGEGVTGTSWDGQIMALKFLGADGFGSTFDAIQAVEYATMMGVDLTNNSWGGGGFSEGLRDAIAAAGDPGQLFIAAAGNTTGGGNDNDINPFYPASYDLDNIISVAATDDNDQLASFSHFGATSVDLGAPGVDILSSIPGGDYGLKDGTSMATPHVAGVASLLLAEEPGLSAEELKDLILTGVDPLPDLEGKTLTGGRLNAFNSLSELGPPAELIGTPEDDVISGTNRGDFINGLGGNDLLQGLGGNDQILGGSGDDLIAAGDGNDTVEGGTGNDNISGNAGNDNITGDDGSDDILGGDGNDSIEGGSEADRILGEAGDDSINGGSGQDSLLGGQGNDLIEGGSQTDLIFGEAGDDSLNGDDGRDTVEGGVGQDSVAGGLGDDLLLGNSGDDSLSGEDGTDTLIGGFDNDFLDGGAGNDQLIGVELTDPESEFGADEIDTLTGGASSDTFVLGDETRVYYDDGDPLTAGESDFAAIADFDDRQDFIQLNGSAELYSLDFLTSELGTTDAALIYDPGVTARGELIATLQDVSTDLSVADPSFTFV